MIKVRSTIVALLLVFVTGQVYAEDKWTITLSGADTIGALKILEKMFGYKPENPTAACLNQRVTMMEDSVWTSADVKVFIKQLANKAGCDVVFDGDNAYTFRLLGA